MHYLDYVGVYKAVSYFCLIFKYKRLFMEVKKSGFCSSEYWCHFCQIDFLSELIPGKDLILCPKCNNDFCQVKTRFSRPEKFKPYQKQPTKKDKNTKKIDKHNVRMTVNELAQILEIRQSENFQITQEMLENIRKKVTTKSECSVCSIDLEENEFGIIPDCKHVFHEECLVEWIKRKNTCPTCRQAIIPTASENQI